MSSIAPSDTLELLRQRAVRTTGPVLVELEHLRDRADLPAAATELLRTGTEMERIIAVLALREAKHRRHEVAQPAILALADPSARVRIAAARALGVIGWPGARAALESASQDRDADVRKHALLGLLELAPVTGVQWIGAALGGVPDARESALAALEDARADKLPDELAQLVDDPDVATRVRAIGILAFSASSSASPLFRALRDGSPDVRLAALNALVRREQAPPVDALPSLFADPDPRVRQRALQVVDRGGGPRHPQSLDLLPHDAPATAAAAVAVLGGAAAIPRLRAMLAESTSAPDRVLVWRAIGRIGEVVPDDTLGAAVLRTGLTDPDDGVRRAAVDAGRWLGPLAAALVTEQLRREPEPRVRAVAVRTLARLLGSAAAPELRRALDDESEDVRRWALDGLGRVGTAGDRGAVERVVAGSPLEQLARWQAIVRLGRGEPALPEATRALADPAHTGRLFTHWYEPSEDFSAIFSRAGMVIVFRDGDRVGEVDSFEVMANGRVRIGDQPCTLRLDRVLIHEPVVSTWGYSLLIKPDPWSSEPQRVVETITWRDD